MDLKKLWSVAEYAQTEDAEQLTRLARNIGCFTISTVGLCLLYRTDGYNSAPALFLHIRHCRLYKH